MEDGEAVVPAGTSLHKALTVFPHEWELIPVAMFVTSSYGHILPKELASSGRLSSLLLKYLHLFLRAHSVLVPMFHLQRNSGWNVPT